MTSQSHAERNHLLESGLLLGDRVVTSSKGGSMVHVNATTGKPQKEFATGVSPSGQGPPASVQCSRPHARW